MPWQFGALGLKEDGGNRLIKYADALINGVRIVIAFRCDSKLAVIGLPE